MAEVIGPKEKEIVGGTGEKDIEEEEEGGKGEAEWAELAAAQWVSFDTLTPRPTARPVSGHNTSNESG